MRAWRSLHAIIGWCPGTGVFIWVWKWALNMMHAVVRYLDIAGLPSDLPPSAPSSRANASRPGGPTQKQKKARLADRS
eukprot:scaffold202063_cov15-Tisochrysis_lutea.AAC.2